MNPIRRILVALVMAAVSVSAQTPAQTPSPPPNEPWPPAGVHKPGEPGLTLPVLVEKTQPAYTREAMRAALQGFVVIAAVIGADGKVSQTRIIQSLDATLGLDDAAVSCVKQWRFTPGSKDGMAVPVAANFDIGFSLHDLPPPSTWPQPFVDTPDPSTTVKPDWTSTTIDSDPLRFDIRYPQGWFERRGGSALTMIQRASLRGIRALGITPPLKVPSTPPFPMPIPQLQRFSDFMRQRNSTRFLDTMGVGQLSVGGLWWVWLDLIVSPSALPPMLQVNGTAAADVRLWSFTTFINSYEVNASCFVVIFNGLGDAVRDEELRAAGRDFRNILSLLTVSKKIASR